PARAPPPPETGLLVPYGHDEEPTAFEARLARALNDLIADPRTATRMGVAGRERAVREFGWDAVARRTAHVYEELLESK
ncbi:glycosyltransferase, partial [Streptomyces sp. NPDC059037]|uniref:glycosyltransferase n=1 Tax=Streptomyces sp. NPDC059037 TaxID=3346710 RepID=UPI0036B4CF41